MAEQDPLHFAKNRTKKNKLLLQKEKKYIVAFGILKFELFQLLSDHFQKKKLLEKPTLYGM
jgi:hypothetical protein